MKIIEINIIQFGKFKDRIFTLEDGFNIVKGDNESGKSTLLGFIKFVLYGVGRKNPSIAVGERERAVSWNIGIAAGSLVIEDVDGKRYRIERNGRESAKGAYSDKAKIFDLLSGEEIVFDTTPGEHFLGIGAQAYDSMCNIKQLEAVAIGADAVKGVIDNLLSSGDENMNVQAAIKILEGERRVLLHANGKGGLLYESEIALDRLKSEYKGALISENERIKNHGELDKVEQALSKAKDEFNIAQKMCDLHDDVLRLQKFDRLRELKEDAERLAQESVELNQSVDFDITKASYEAAASMKTASSTLQRSENTLNSARNELNETEQAFSKLSFDDTKGLGEIIEEFGTPNAAITHLGAKKKKKSSSALMLTMFFVAGGVLAALAIALLIAPNYAGAATLGFIAAVLLVLAATYYKKFTRAKGEIESFMKNMGNDFCSKNEEKIFVALEKFYNEISERTRLTNVRESAKFRCNVAQDAYFADLSSAKGLAQDNGLDCSDSELFENLVALADKMNSYLSKRYELDEKIRENQALIRALGGELERFSERDLRARITPEIIERIMNVPYERLKAERDSALYKTNQYNQYKASVERNLASASGKRSSQDVFPEIEEAEERLSTLRLRLDAIRLAAATINEASSELKSDLTPRIRGEAEKNLAKMTSGKYAELYIDENMGLSVFADGATRPIDSLSKGSLDVAYFSVRLALLQTLIAEKYPPLYMDETLSQLDDKRAKNALSLISDYAKSTQCVLFTCQDRDLSLAREITEVNLIEL